MLYLLISTSLVIDNYINYRIYQYIREINNILNIFNKNIKNIKIIIIENNGNTNTFLDNFGVDVFYTNTNNILKTQNKGIKEITDILLCIDKYNIKDDDLIVKITGRYILKEDSIFIKELTNISDNIECIIRYGNYFDLSSTCKTDCITGLIAMKCKYIKQIEYINEDDCIEWEWARKSQLIDTKNIIELRELGLLICPSSYTEYIDI